MRRILRGLAGAAVVAALVGASAWQARAQETVSGSLVMQIRAFNKLLVGLRTVETSLNQDYTLGLTSGTGANQANALYQTQLTIGASGTTTLDLNGSVTDDFGQSVTCTKVKGLVVKAASGNTNNVLIGGGATTVTSLTTTGALPALVVRPGGVMMWTFPDSTGAAVTAGSADIIQFANSAGSTSVTADVIVFCVE